MLGRDRHSRPGIRRRRTAVLGRIVSVRACLRTHAAVGGRARRQSTMIMAQNSLRSLRPNASKSHPHNDPPRAGSDCSTAVGLPGTVSLVGAGSRTTRGLGTLKLLSQPADSVPSSYRNWKQRNQSPPHDQSAPITALSDLPNQTGTAELLGYGRNSWDQLTVLLVGAEAAGPTIAASTSGRSPRNRSRSAIGSRLELRAHCRRYARQSRSVGRCRSASYPNSRSVASTSGPRLVTGVFG